MAFCHDDLDVTYSCFQSRSWPAMVRDKKSPSRGRTRFCRITTEEKRHDGFAAAAAQKRHAP